jgi:hypothetical protein
MEAPMTPDLHRIPHAHVPVRRPVSLCGQDLPPSSHICAFFDSRDQQYDVLLPYFREGLENGEQVVSIFDADMNPGHLARLAQGGIDMAEATVARQLRVMTTEESYLQGGFFDAERMYGMIEEVLHRAPETAHPYVRTCGEMTWALRHLEATEQLIEYEARINMLLEQHQCTLMCIYDVNLFSGQVLMDVLATHPQVLMGQSVMENRYYVPPMQYLKKLLQRRGAPLRREAQPA